MSTPTSEDFHRWLAEHHPYMCNTPTDAGLSVILDWLTEIGWTNDKQALTEATRTLDTLENWLHQMVCQYIPDGQYDGDEGVLPVITTWLAAVTAERKASRALAEALTQWADTREAGELDDDRHPQTRNVLAELDRFNRAQMSL